MVAAAMNDAPTLPKDVSLEARHIRAIFTEGSIARHLFVMTLTGAIGTMVVFLVDLAGLYFLSLLEKTAVTAAVGYADGILLLVLAVALGMSVATSVLVSRSMGAGDRERAREYAASAVLFSILLSSTIVFAIVLFSESILSLMGARGEAKHLAKLFIWTISPGYILCGASLCLAAILRGIGDARRSMYVTLSLASVTLCLDPVLIFGMGWGIQGAAVATLLGETVALCVGLHGVVKAQDAMGPIRLRGLLRDVPDIWTIAYPAILSQLTIPLANEYMTSVMSRFGDEAEAGFAIVCRLIPVAFGLVFALSSAVSPVLGQNYGAGQHDRVRSTITQSLLISSVYTLTMSMLLLVLSERIAMAFNAVGQSYDLVTYFCTFIGVSWAFTGAQFVATSVFNNLGQPRLSALFSWGRVILGTLPLVWLGAAWAGPEGIVTGNAIGGAIFGSVAIVVAYRLASSKGTRLDGTATSRVA